MDSSRQNHPCMQSRVYGKFLGILRFTIYWVWHSGCAPKEYYSTVPRSMRTYCRRCNNAFFFGLGAC
eukprot:6853171-Pyramimonas_sp.AAC.1